MNTKKHLIITSVIMVLLVVGYYTWKASAEPFGDRFVSPDGRFYVQKYEVFTFSRFLFTTPGSGSDNIDGFIRLYRADGKMLKEAFRTFLVSIEIDWYEDGVAAGRGDIFWKLPN